MTDRDLETRFAELRQEVQGRVPPFAPMVAHARHEAETDSLSPTRPTAPWWRAIPAGAVLAAAGLGAIALAAGPRGGEARFRQAVEWTQDNPLATRLGVPSDVLLEPPRWAVWTSATPSGGPGSSLSDMLDLVTPIDDGRNDS